jgi:zinc/manganese transport system substrate-binding protein
MSAHRRLRSITAVALLASVVAACAAAPRDNGASTGPASRPLVVATSSVVRSIVELVAGGAVQVRSLVPDGKDPHEYEPSAADIASLNGARLVVQVGLEYEHSVEDVVGRKASEGVPVFNLVDHVRVVNGDPHVFTDPLTVADSVDDLAGEIASLTGGDAHAMAERARGILTRAAATARERLAPVVAESACLLVTDHDSLEYFARRFGCEVIGVITPSFSSSAEASAAQVQSIVEMVAGSRDKPTEVRAIFVEHGASTAVAGKIAEVTGVRIVELRVHSLPSDNTYETYVTELAHTIVKGLTA